MRPPALFHPRQLWIPTLFGWLCCLVMLVGTVLWAVWQLHPFLALNQPSGADLLVIEGWIPPEEIDQAIVRFKSGHYTHVITTGSQVPANLCQNKHISYAELARDYILKQGLANHQVTAVPTPQSAQDRTYLSAVMVREWLARSRVTIDALDVFSSGVHSRRSGTVYRLAFGPTVSIGILAAQPIDYDPATWWRTSVGAKTVMAEMISWLWTELLFWPAAPGSYEEKWGRAPTVQSVK